METILFNKLLENSKCDTGNDISIIGFRAKHNSYHMSFYACDSEDYKVIVEDFGTVVEGKWKQLDASLQQIAEMQKLIDKKLEELSGIVSIRNSDDWDVRAEQGIYGYGY